MLTAEQKEEIEYIKSRTLAAFPLLGVTLSQLEVIADDRVGTAMTTGDKIYYSPKYFNELSDDEEVFVFSHEVFHVAFEHITRCKGHDMDLWNIATDSVINQLLKQEGLPIKEGLVDIPEALGKSAEEMYEILLERRKQKQKEWEEHLKEMMDKAKDMADQQKQEQSQSEPQGQEQPQPSPQSQTELPEQNNTDPLDDWANQPPMPELPEFKFNLPNHEIWKEVMKENEDDLEEEDIFDINADMNEAEKQFSQQNQREQAKRAMKYFQDQKEIEEGAKAELSSGTFRINSDELATAKQAKELNWKRLLKNSLEREVLKWSSKDACKENDYASKLVEVEVEDLAETEVMLDISSSVDVNLLKEFLRQLKPLVKDSVLSVGYFNQGTTGFTPVKTAKDIERLNVLHPNGWTNLDAAVRSFSKKREVNKVVFTDGEGIMPKEDLKKVNVIWVIYGQSADSFKPCCGKVIYVNEAKIMEEGRRRRGYLIDNNKKKR